MRYEQLCTCYHWDLQLDTFNRPWPLWHSCWCHSWAYQSTFKEEWLLWCTWGNCWFCCRCHTTYGSRGKIFYYQKVLMLKLWKSVKSGAFFWEYILLSSMWRLTIYAFCDIEEGQEITISYLNGTSDYAERQRDLKKKFKFDCKCELCSLPPAQREESDFRLNKIKFIDEAIGDFSEIASEPETGLHLIHTMLGLFEEEGIWDAGIPRAYYDAYQIAIASGDEARARTFAKRAYAARAVIEGDDSPNTTKLKRLAEQPSEPINDGPPETSEDELENWLWKEKEWSEHLSTSSSEDPWGSWDSIPQRPGPPSELSSTPLTIQTHGPRSLATTTHS